MKAKKIGNKYFLRLDKGEEVVAALKNFCRENGIRAGYLIGIGATNQATVGLFETGTKTYRSRELKGDYEIAPLAGNISTMNGEVYLHLHANLCNQESVAGGHLDKAIISATCEIVIETIDEKIDREYDENIGLNLLNF